MYNCLWYGYIYKYKRGSTSHQKYECSQVPKFYCSEYQKFFKQAIRYKIHMFSKQKLIIINNFKK